MRDDDVVEGPVPLAEAGEADADYHCAGGMRSVSATVCGEEELEGRSGGARCSNC